jgi:hypothetical protein
LHIKLFAATALALLRRHCKYRAAEQISGGAALNCVLTLAPAANSG